ncbi:hypothetical protein RYU24_11900 [Acinetobacter variabilis]|nr:hypothetical protein RYU24_11900 [Acinetobacter variabilis]
MFSVYKKNRRYLSRRMVAVKPLLWSSQTFALDLLQKDVRTALDLMQNQNLGLDI